MLNSVEQFMTNMLGCSTADLIMLEDVYSRLAEDCIGNINGMVNDVIGECGIGECFNDILHKAYETITNEVFDKATDLIKMDIYMWELVDGTDLCDEDEDTIVGYYREGRINTQVILDEIAKEKDEAFKGIYCNYLDTNFGGLCKDWLDLDNSLDSNARCILREVIRNIELEDLVVGYGK